jgi:hypothetical protein
MLNYVLKLGIQPSNNVCTQDYILPKHLCKKLFNIYHPLDPLVCIV